jgi:hypothetical protein
MPHRDITGTDAQGVPAGPRPDQAPQAPAAPGVLDLAEAEEVVVEEADEETDPVVDVDDLGAAVEGDGDRPVDRTAGKRRVGHHDGQP